MRLIRARHRTDVVLARDDGDQAVVLARESRHPAADVVRETLAASVDLGGR